MRVALAARLRRSIALVAVALAGGAVVLGGCAAAPLVGSGSGEDARFRHRELGYEIAYPAVLREPGWRIEPVDEADLLVRDEGGRLWALASTCRATAAALPLLAGELARATGGERVGPLEPIALAGLDGLVQRLSREDEGVRLAIKTVTLRGTRCAYDWILIAPKGVRFAALEPRFDRWWQSFRPGPSERPPGRGEPAASRPAASP